MLLVVGIHKQEIPDQICIGKLHASGVDALENNLWIIFSLFEDYGNNLQLVHRIHDIQRLDAILDPALNAILGQHIVLIDMAFLIHIIELSGKKSKELLVIGLDRFELHLVLLFAEIVLDEGHELVCCRVGDFIGDINQRF